MATQEGVYPDAGRALEAANLLETELGTCLLALDALERGSHIKPDDDAYLRLREAIDSKTLASHFMLSGENCKSPKTCTPCSRMRWTRETSSCRSSFRTTA